jgi:ubiquinone/menaquinone biosynthesis C-methylase UbiE
MPVLREWACPVAYDLFCRILERELGPRRRALLAHARGRVLEIGAGTGANLPHYPPTIGELTITEPAAGMLRRAKQKAGGVGRAIDAVEASAERLPFEDEFFDTVVSTLVLCSVEDQDRALTEIRRVLKPGGRMLFIEHVRADEPRPARWQDRLERPWVLVSGGCHPNRRTLERIRTASFEVEELESGNLPKSPPILRPLISGYARAR